VFDVPGVTINPNCGRSGQSTVTFQVGSQTAAQTATYRDGGYQQLNLTVGGGGAQPTATATAAPTATATPRPTTTPAPTAAPTTAPTAAPTTAPTATPRPPTVTPQRPAGTPAAQRPAAPAAAAPAAAAPAAQRPAAAAPAALPRTGTGGMQADAGMTTGWMFVGGALALFSIAGAGLALRTRRSRS
jgi:hypothetical protein